MLTIVKFQEKEGNQYLNNGVIHVNSNKPEFGSIQLKSTPTFKKGLGAFALESRTAFYTDRVANLELLNLTAGASFDEIVGVPCKIIKLESIEKEEGFRALINPSNNQEICTPDGEPIYWCTKIVEADSDETDIILTHAKAEVLAEAKEAKVLAEIRG